MLHALSTVAFVLLGAGLLVRRWREVHIPVMLSAFAVDLGLVLYIECTRAAVEKVVLRRPGVLIIFHAMVSTCVLGLYVAMALMGNRVRRGEERWRSWHGRTGWALAICRTANYVTSWMV